MSDALAVNMLQEMEQIETIWELTKDWEIHWADWKTGKFTELHTEDMADLSNNIFKKLYKLAKELKVAYTVALLQNIYHF